MDETSADVISRRAEFLVEYQDAAYADRYQQTLKRFAEAVPAGAEDLLRTAAKSLFKLMAFKDEYEVARLHRSSAFSERLKAEFEGDYTVNYHLAPPLLPLGKDTRGRPNKRAFGPWMGSVFGLLARMRRLRGRWADPFRHHADRRLEVELITWFENILEVLPSHYSSGQHTLIKSLLQAPMEIRGYGPVKEDAARAVREKVVKGIAGLS